ncbi:hypothetical protein [Burkholderia ubonensis]|uniref:Secreted protein n=1 Tax=Burkholderia ubonensis TaxID=101571 RepID=A0AAW3N9S0_9BURK|nr:hypothetical protein [Burkholderia ubonensis]KVT48953.1 hypothetical protein WK53_01015 [Burkholderia ubonensis]KVW44851.1 hypothetical protein WK95_09380 [Burkholderia ubonensis]
MQTVKTWCVSVALSMAVAGSATAFARPPAEDCLTQAEVKQLDRDFWATFPSPDGFAAYAAPDFSFNTNVADLSQSLAHAPKGPARARAVATFLGQHPDLYGSFKTALDSTYLYYPGRDHHPDAVRTSATFPANRCVSEFNFAGNEKSSQCVYGQRTRAFVLSFIKDHGRVTLQTGMLGMEACN